MSGPGKTLPVADTAKLRAAARRELTADFGTVLGIVVFTALAATAGLIGPWLIGRIVDTIKTGTDTHALATIDWLALIILTCTVAQTVLSRYAFWFGYRFGERTAGRIRHRFVQRIPSSAVDHVNTGDLIARGATDSTTIATALRRAVPEVLVAVVQALFLVVAVLVLNPLLGVCGLLCFAGIGVALRWYLRRARTAYLAEAASGADLADVVTSTARGARTIETLGLAHTRAAAAETAIDHARTARLRTLWLRSVLFPTVDVSYLLPVGGVLLTGAALNNVNLVSLGTIISATIYLRQLVGPMDTIMLWVEQVQGAVAAYARVEGLAEVPIPTEGNRDLRPRDDRITIRDVSYAYDHGRDVLVDINLAINPGERLALVGTSGAGKSTLGRLIAGLDHPRTGSVTVGDVPTADLPPGRIREQVVLVTQDHHIFQDSVRDNLLIAKPTADDTELTHALTAVGAHWVPTLPQGLDTPLGQDITLDGAQAQQLSLARVLLANPHTLILDEATALLDPTTARATEQAIAAVLRDRTVIAIAHRLQTAHDADRIAVLDSGKLIELGAHEELIHANGQYSKLWHSWHTDSTTNNHNR